MFICQRNQNFVCETFSETECSKYQEDCIYNPIFKECYDNNVSSQTNCNIFTNNDDCDNNSNTVCKWTITGECKQIKTEEEEKDDNGEEKKEEEKEVEEDSKSSFINFSFFIYSFFYFLF